jgi:pimeloyl-ACP methyl ester carboxylesterase
MAGWRSRAVAAWEGRGAYLQLEGFEVFTLDVPPAGSEDHEPLLVLHGFPTSSFDFHLVVDELAAHRRVLLLDMVGYGLSEKPDMAYTLEMQADLAEALVAASGVSTLALLTHDMGDTVGGELLARQAEGRWPVQVTRRVVTNGSVYIEMAHLSDGQSALLALPDARLADGGPQPDADAMSAALSSTFSEASEVDGSELAAAWELIAHRGGQLVLPRTIRYIEQRRRSQARYTGAIESHPSPLGIVWGRDDPIAVAAMAERLQSSSGGSRLRWLDGTGHYPMIESPDNFLGAVLDLLG